MRRVLILLAACLLLSACTSNSADRIVPSAVTVRNVAQFERQVRDDLPIGTSKVAVEAYLTRWNIDHSFGQSPQYANAFWGLVYTGETTWLQIRIDLDTEERVRNLNSFLQRSHNSAFCSAVNRIRDVTILHLLSRKIRRCCPDLLNPPEHPGRLNVANPLNVRAQLAGRKRLWARGARLPEFSQLGGRALRRRPRSLARVRGANWGGG